MAQSPEYPDLKWVPPKSWTNANRSSVQLIVIHTTEGSAHAQSAEDGAAYDARRTDGTSAHYFVDSNTVVQCVRTNDQAHTARSQGNRRGIQYELCGRAGWSAATWAGDYQQAMLRLAARQAARDAKKWDIPVRHLTVAQVAAGAKGFCSHHDITRAFPQDNGSHTDPGPNFPWTQFLNLVRAELEEDDMPTAEEIARATWAYPLSSPWLGVEDRPAGDWIKFADAGRRDMTELGKSLTAAIQAVAAKDSVDEQALAAELAPAVAALVVSRLPSGTDPVSQEEVTTAVKAALRDAFAAS
jgi:N-acetyl-anhydromuramyl-L-alanine amidase AmpD